MNETSNMNIHLDTYSINTVYLLRVHNFRTGCKLRTRNYSLISSLTTNNRK